MNASLSTIADAEADSRFMPTVPSAWQDKGNGRCEEIPLVNRKFLEKCGIESLYLVAEELDIVERFSAETKSELVDLILERAKAGNPPANIIPPPMIPPKPLTAKERQRNRALKRALKAQIKVIRTQ